MIYQGQYWNGKRQGQGKEYVNHQLNLNCIWIKGYSSHRILRFSVTWFFICIICSFYLIPSVGMTLLITDFLLLWLLWRCNPVFSVVLRSVVKRSETTPRNHDSSSDPRIFIFLLNWLTFIHILNSLIPVLIVISSFQKHSIVENCFGSYPATSLTILSGKCNDHSISQFDVQSFKALESIRIGNHCFENVNTFKIDGLDRLRLLIIGIDSFTKSLQGIDSSRSFQLENCEELDSIEIGYGSFSDYSIFELKNLPLLSSIQIGEIGRDSFNFYHSSFTIKGS